MLFSNDLTDSPVSNPCGHAVLFFLNSFHFHFDSFLTVLVILNK